MDGKVLGRRIKEARERLERNRNQMARELGTSWQHVDRWERGVTEPSPESLRKLADYLGVTVDHLLGASQLPHPVEAAEPAGMAAGLQEFLRSYAPADLSEAEVAWLAAAPIDRERATPGDYVNILHGLRSSAHGPDRRPPAKSGRQSTVRPQDVEARLKENG